MTRLILFVFTIISLNTLGQQGQPTHIHDLGVSVPTNLYVFNDKLYFSASSPSSGNEMWVYDNSMSISATNPKMLIDLDTSSTSTFPRKYFEYNGKLFFTTNNALYSYVDNQPISQTNPRYICPRANGLAIQDNKLYFEISANTPRTIWVFDDSLPVSGTNPQQLVNQFVNPIKTSNNFKPFVFQDKMYFSATNNTSTGDELWVYDNTIPTSATNPVMLMNINPNNSSSVSSNGSNPSDFILYKNNMYFSADDGTGSELWVYDGTLLPQKVYDIDPSPYGGLALYKTILDDTLYFAGHDQFGTELWKYDGINTPTLVADIYAGSNYSIPSNLKVFGNRLIFNANNGTNGRELWCYNNSLSVSNSNPFLIYDLNSGTSNSVSNGADNSYVIYDNILYFGASGGSNIGGLWALTLCDIGAANPPVFSLGNDTTIYVGDSIELTGPVQMNSYSWSNNAANNYQMYFIGDINNIGNNNISLTVVDSNFCSYSNNINIIVYSLEDFNLVSPANSSTNQKYSSLVLDWSDNTGAINYELQIDTTQSFTTNPQTYTTSNSMYSVTLLPSKTYYWKVRASNGSTWGQWTTPWSFTTNSLENFNLISPANSSTNQEYSSLIFEWSENVGATSYELQIDTTQSFTASPLSYTTSDSTYTVTLLPSKTYHWKVRASNGTTWGQWSSVWSFTTKEDVSTSIHEIYFSDIKIYPNPVLDIINIETNNILFNKPFNLFDNTGRVIYSGFINREQVTISLKALSTGIYFLQIGDYPQQTYKLLKE
ncbi:MAG: T9SS type A sorting domain-containing protein [Chitinophagales bacterium]